MLYETYREALTDADRRFMTTFSRVLLITSNASVAVVIGMSCWFVDFSWTKIVENVLPLALILFSVTNLIAVPVWLRARRRARTSTYKTVVKSVITRIDPANDQDDTPCLTLHLGESRYRVREHKLLPVLNVGDIVELHYCHDVDRDWQHLSQVVKR